MLNQETIIAGLKKDPVTTISFIRVSLQELFTVNPDLVTQFGIRIVERFENRPEDEDCFRYLFPGQDCQQVTDRLLDEYTQISGPKPGAIILYAADLVYPKHVGKVTKNGYTVISKWGQGHVLEHHPLWVPKMYGDHLYFFEEPSESPYQNPVSYLQGETL